MAAALLALVLGAKHLRCGNDRWFRRGLAVLVVTNGVSAWIFTAVQGTARIPLQLCDLALLMVVWALWSLQPAVTELAYFWGLGGSLQAILTPDLHDPFPSFGWAQFFFTHGSIVLSVVYLAVTGRVRPSAQSTWRAWGWLNGYALVAGLANWMFGTNFGYLAHKPSQPSLLDFFGPWPYYIVVMEIAALASFYLLYYLALAQARRSTP